MTVGLTMAALKSEYGRHEASKEFVGWGNGRTIPVNDYTKEEQLKDSCQSQLLGWHRQPVVLKHCYLMTKLVHFGYAFSIACDSQLTFVIVQFKKF